MKIELSEAVNLTLNIQSELEHLSPSIGNVCLWPVIRNAIYDNLFHGHFASNSDYPNELLKTSKNPITLLKSIWCLRKSKILIRNLYDSKNKHLFIFEPDGVEFNEKIDGKRFNHYKDPYYEALDEYSKVDRLKIIEEPTSFVSNDFHASEETSLYLYKQYKLLHKIIFSIRHKKQIKELDLYISLINKIYDENNISKKLYFNKIISFISEIFFYISYYTLILKIKSPFSVFTCCYFRSIHSYAIMVASKNLGIPTFDIQHGCITHHFLHWSKASNEYLFLPDHYITWGDIHEHFFNKKSPTNQISPLSGFNLWLHKHKRGDIPKPSCYKINKNLKYKKKVLFIHQWVKHRWNTTSLIELINNCPKDWLWLYRFHPSTEGLMRREIETAFEDIENVEFEESSKLPLPCLLDETDICITRYSATAFDCYDYQTPVVFVDNGALLYFEDIIDGETNHLAVNTDEIVQILKTNTFNLSYAGLRNEKQKFVEEIEKTMNI